jgi:acetyl-CoA carboxylase carboxyltransferase component
MLGHLDVLVLGGYSAFTWLTEKLSNEVAARTRQTNAAIAERYETLAERQIAAATAWLDTLAPPAATLDAVATLIDRVRAGA